MERQGELAELWIVFRRRDPTPPYTPRTWARRIDDGVCPTVASSPPPGALIAESL